MSLSIIDAQIASYNRLLRERQALQDGTHNHYLAIDEKANRLTELLGAKMNGDQSIHTSELLNRLLEILNEIIENVPADSETAKLCNQFKQEIENIIVSTTTNNNSAPLIDLPIIDLNHLQSTNQPQVQVEPNIAHKEKPAESEYSQANTTPANNSDEPCGYSLGTQLRYYLAILNDVSEETQLAAHEKVLELQQKFAECSPDLTEMLNEVFELCNVMQSTMTSDDEYIPLINQFKQEIESIIQHVNNQNETVAKNDDTGRFVVGTPKADAEDAVIKLIDALFADPAVLNKDRNLCALAITLALIMMQLTIDEANLRLEDHQRFLEASKLYSGLLLLMNMFATRADSATQQANNFNNGGGDALVLDKLEDFYAWLDASHDPIDWSKAPRFIKGIDPEVETDFQKAAQSALDAYRKAEKDHPDKTQQNKADYRNAIKNAVSTAIANSPGKNFYMQFPIPETEIPLDLKKFVSGNPVWIGKNEIISLFKDISKDLSTIVEHGDNNQFMQHGELLFTNAKRMKSTSNSVEQIMKTTKSREDKNQDQITAAQNKQKSFFDVIKDWLEKLKIAVIG